MVSGCRLGSGWQVLRCAVLFKNSSTPPAGALDRASDSHAGCTARYHHRTTIMVTVEAEMIERRACWQSPLAHTVAVA